ncbi:MAG: hypothetical protein PHV34_13475 [Verrucomicrobiae bacterium]|nr:hypothetical protein [Verrucomicrobiae bacterium]
MFCILVGLFLGLTFIQRRNLKMGDELKMLERELQSAREKTQSLRSELAHYCTPRELEKSMARFQIAMTRPSEDQIRRRADPDASESGIIAPRLLVQHEPVRLTARTP